MTSKNLTIKLISPKMSLRPMDSELKRRMSPSLSLVIVASLTPKEHYVYIEDENLHDINFSDSPDLVGINVNVDTFYRATEISKMYRDKGVKVVFGGIFASSKPETVIEYCDAVCIGEAEGLWEKIINDVIDDKLQRFYYSEESVDLSIVPIPDWSYVEVNKYLYNNIIVTSRGCPFKCDFCYNSCQYMKSEYRNRPIDHVIAEIDRMNTKQVMFIDDNFIGNIDWVKIFLKKIKDKNLIWHAAVSTNLVKYPELIKEFAETGCRSLFIGFESINSNSISSVNKKQNKIDEYEKLIKLIHDNGIMINASLVFGFDSDTLETFDNTLKWLIKNKIETMTSHILTPYPGTKLYEKLDNENRIIDKNLRHYNTSNVVFMPKQLSPECLKSEYLNIYKNFYSIKSIIKRKPENRQILASYFMFNFGYRKYGKFTSILGKMGLMNKIGKIARKIAYGID